MLNQPLPSTRRLLAGTICVTALALACGYAAWASQPPVPSQTVPSQTVPAGQLRMDLSLRIDEGAPLAASQLAAAGAPVILRQSVDGHAWVVTAHAAPASGGTHQLDALITRDGRQVAAPRLVVQPGVPARIHVGDDASAVGGRFTGVQLDVTVTGPGPGATAVASTDAATITFAALSGPMPSPSDGSQLQAPAYPADALARKIDGTVVLGIDIDAAGKVTAVDVVRSEPAGVFDAAATKAAWNWRLPPAMKDGKPVAGRVEVPVRFEHGRAKDGGAEGGGAKPQV